MAIMKSGPGKRAKTTTNKATVKGAVNMVKNLFSTGSKNLGKAKGPGGLAGVVSNKGGVRTTTSAKVTGSKKSGIESLKAKRKSGEMTRQEANAKIQALRGGKQPVKSEKPKYERGQSKMFSYSTSKGGSTYYATPGAIKKDSAEFMNQLKTASPAAYEMAVKYMKSEQAKSPGSRFQFGATPVRVDQFAVKQGTGKPKYVSGTDKRFVAYNPTITTLNKKKSGKKQ
jgi:hypothetical protein